MQDVQTDSPEQVTGSCLCGEVTYQLDGNLGIFQYCHCSRCRKFTGSAHAANILVKPEQFSWLSGSQQIGTFIPEETKHFTTAFCKKCGSSLPWLAKSGKAMVIPAGTLDSHPGIEPQQNVFRASAADWYQPAKDLPEWDCLPEK